MTTGCALKAVFQFYDQFVEPEQFDPRDELKRSKTAIEHYLQRRADFAYVSAFRVLKFHRLPSLGRGPPS